MQEAHARYVLNRNQQATAAGTPDAIPVEDVAIAYLAYCQSSSRRATFESRGRMLFDFVYGLRGRYWNYGGTRKRVPKPTRTDYIHDGYGKRAVGDLIPMDIQRWLDKHPTWGQSTRRIAVQAVKRAFNYARKMGLITANPISAFKTQAGKKRITYFTPEVEQAMYRHSRPAFRTILKVLIRTERGTARNSVA